MNKLENEKQALINFIDSLKRLGYSEFDNATITTADVKSRRFTITIKGTHILSDGNSYEYRNDVTDYMKYPEMNQFLRGYMFAKQNHFKKYEHETQQT